MRGEARAYLLQIGLRAVGLVAMAAFFAVAARAVAEGPFADYVAALAIYSIAVVLSDFGLSQTAVVDLADPGHDPHVVTGAVVRAMVVTTSLALVVGAVVGLAVSTSVALVLLTMLPSFLLSQAQVPFVVARQHLHAFARVGLAESGGRLVALAALLVVVVAVDAVTPGWIVLASTIGVGIQLLLLVGRLPGSVATRGGTVAILKRSSSLGLTNAAAYLHMRTDQVLLAMLSTSLVVASYAVAYRVVDAALGLVSAVSILGLPILARTEHGQRNAVARDLHSLLLGLASLGAISAFLLAAPLTRLLGGSEYVSAASILRLLVPAMWISVMNLVGALVLVAERRTGVLVWVGVITVGLNVALNAALIPVWDGEGAAAATVASEAAGAIVVGVIAARQLPGMYRLASLLFCAVASVVGSVGVWAAWQAGLAPIAVILLVVAVIGIVGSAGGFGAFRDLQRRGSGRSGLDDGLAALDDPVIRDLA